jgi:hypothetical protein
MLHALVMTVEVGETGTSRNDPAATEARPNGATPLAPVAVVSEPREPASEAARDPKARHSPAKAGVAKVGAGAEELRAGLKRMLKKKRIPATELETVQAEGTEAPAPAE